MKRLSLALQHLATTEKLGKPAKAAHRWRENQFWKPRRSRLEELECRALLDGTMEFQHVIFDPSRGTGSTLAPSGLPADYAPLGSSTPGGASRPRRFDRPMGSARLS